MPEIGTADDVTNLVKGSTQKQTNPQHCNGVKSPVSVHLMKGVAGDVS